MASFAPFQTVRAGTLQVLAGLDEELRKQVVLGAAVFPRSANLTDVALVSGSYDGTAVDFALTAKMLSSDIELKALGTHLAVKEVLDVMKEGTTFLDLGLDVVDFIVIQRIGRHILRITRTFRPGESASGRALFLELNDIRARTSELLRNFKAQGADHTLAVAAAGVVVVFLALGSVLAMALTRAR